MLSDLAEYAFSEKPDHARILPESARKLFIIEKLDCRIEHFYNINITKSLDLCTKSKCFCLRPEKMVL